MLILQAFKIQLKWINVDQSWTDKSLSGRFGVKTKWAKCLSYRKNLSCFIDGHLRHQLLITKMDKHRTIAEVVNSEKLTFEFSVFVVWVASVQKSG